MRYHWAPGGVGGTGLRIWVLPHYNSSQVAHYA